MPDQNDPGGMAALQQVRPRILGNPNDPPLVQWPPSGPPPRFIQVPVPLWERIMSTVFGPRTPAGTVEQTRRVPAEPYGPFRDNEQIDQVLRMNPVSPDERNRVGFPRWGAAYDRGRPGEQQR